MHTYEENRENFEQGHEHTDQYAENLIENPYESKKEAASVIDKKKNSINSMFNLTFTSTIADDQNFAPVNHIMIAKTRKQSKKKISPAKE